MSDYLLSILIFLPLAMSMLIALAPLGHRQARVLTLVVTLVQAVIAIYLFISFDAEQSGPGIQGFQFVEHLSWFTFELPGYGSIRAEYLLGVDGLGLSMVLLSTIVMTIATISSWKQDDRAKGYFALFLLLNGAIIGCFVALDFLLFYLFFEFMLLPMYFLIGLWGGPRREYASIKFFLYTLLGSIFILIALIALNMSTVDPVRSVQLAGLGQVSVTEAQQMLQSGAITPGNQVHTFNMLLMSDPSNLIPGSIMDVGVMRTILGLPARLFAFLLVFIGFAIKLPMVPLHTWLPDAHVEAPTPISVILAGILLKVGGYGLIRAGVLIFPDGLLHFSWWLGLFGVVSIIYGGLNALASKDLKRLIAYSSVSHMGFVLLGIASVTVEGFSGAIYQMFSHGLISSGLFLVAGVLYDRTHDRMIDNYSGLASKMGRYATVASVFFFASLGLPGFSGFIAELFIFLGSFTSSYLPMWMMVAATTGLVLSAAYYLWTIQRMFYGKYQYKLQPDFNWSDLTTRELIMLVPLIVGVILFGLFPDLLLEPIESTVAGFLMLIQETGAVNLNSIR